ncbi:MAG: DUF2723 domain-containing protein [Chloroflexota bacterium]
MTWFAAAAVVVFAFGIYLRTMLPGLGFWDTGEAQTVPHTLSIFHPTGFPTYTLLGWAWSQLPFGNVAYRMNVMSGVSMALTAGLVALIAARLIEERHRPTVAAAAGIAGLAFAMASEPWDNAARADVHALHALVVASVLWLLLTWRSAVRRASPRSGRWLMAAALVFGLGLGNHPLTGLLAFGIAPFLFLVDPNLWRKPQLIVACAALLVIGLGVYLYIPLRATIGPEPPLFYARPDSADRLRYLLFAEQFRDLFAHFDDPLAFFAQRWDKTESVLAAQFIGPGWLLVAFGAATVAVQRTSTFMLLSLIVVVNIWYSMNFQDGDIDRYYLTTVIVAAPLLGVAIAGLAATCARAAAELGRRLGRVARRRVAAAASLVVLLLTLLLPAGSLVTLYDARDRSADHEADRWVASVFDALPPDSVILSWWSYSTPLWYHRWVLGERPDVTIIDERNMLDDGYATWDGAIRAFIGKRPVYLVPPEWESQRLLRLFDTETISTYAGYTKLQRVKEPAEL